MADRAFHLPSGRSQFWGEASGGIVDIVQHDSNLSSWKTDVWKTSWVLGRYGCFVDPPERCRGIAHDNRSPFDVLLGLHTLFRLEDVGTR